MGTTPNYNLRYPELTDAPNAPLAFRNLAEDVEGVLDSLDVDSIPETLVNAKGDLIVATAADTVARLAVGSNGQVLTADSSAASGVKWAGTPTSGAQTAYVATSGAPSSTSYSDLGTAGPSVSVA